MRMMKNNPSFPCNVLQIHISTMHFQKMYSISSLLMRCVFSEIIVSVKYMEQLILCLKNMFQGNISAFGILRNVIPLYAFPNQIIYH